MLLFAALLKSLPAGDIDPDAAEAREWYASCLVADGRGRPSSGSAPSIERPIPAIAGVPGDCATMRRQLRDLEAEAAFVRDARYRDELNDTRQDIVTRMTREHC